jgi:hypothetical protein
MKQKHYPPDGSIVISNYNTSSCSILYQAFAKHDDHNYQNRRKNYKCTEYRKGHWKKHQYATEMYLLKLMK